MTKSKRADQKGLVFAAALIVALGGLIYELLLGTASSYLFGDSVKSFSLAIGTMLFGMGLGSLLSACYLKNAAENFVWNELLISFVGGNAVLILFLAFNYTPLYWLVFVLLSILIGICIGMEIPLMVSLVKQHSKKTTEHILTRILALDYVGALVASIIFPFILLPYLGLLRTSYAVALINVCVAGVVLFRIQEAKKVVVQVVTWAALIIYLLFALLFINRLETRILTSQYRDPVVFMKLSQYQKIVVTKYKDDIRLFLNDQLQFSSVDEARYHEVLAHGVLSSIEEPKSILILGGGDGILAREVLKYPSVQHVEIIDIDPEVTKLARENRVLREINNDSMLNPKVKIINQDAFNYVRDSDTRYDAILIDLVDPANERVAKLYSQEFYIGALGRLSEDGVLATQATSTFFTPNAFKTISKTVQQADPKRNIYPMSINVPSFGEWGFVMSVPKDTQLFTNSIPESARIANSDMLHKALSLPTDFDNDYTKIKSSHLLNPHVYVVYTNDMERWSY